MYFIRDGYLLNKAKTKWMLILILTSKSFAWWNRAYFLHQASGQNQELVKDSELADS